MNEREEFLRYFGPVFINLVERLDTMTEDQVLESLHEVKTARKVWAEEFARRIEEMTQPGPRERPEVELALGYTREQVDYLASIQTSFQSFLNSRKKLRSRAGAKSRSGGASPDDSLEDALNERLDLLRKRPELDS